MKKMFIFFLFFIISFTCYSDDLIYLVDTKFTKDQMYIQAKNWLSTNFSPIDKKTRISTGTLAAPPNYDYMEGINENGYYKILNDDNVNYSITSEIVCFKVKNAYKNIGGEENWGLKFNLVLELTCSPFFVPFYEGKTQALFPINS